MNRTFKVVFNKARGALMVANEATCSVQKKGTKTVVAAAVAMMLSGAAVAAEYAGNITEEQTWSAGDTVSEVVIQDGAKVTLTGSVANQDRESNFTISGGSVTVGDGAADLGLFVGGDFEIQGGEVTVKGTATGGQNPAGEITKALATVGGYDNFSMSGGVLNLENARAWVGSWTSSETGSTTFNDMVLSGGTVNLKNGGLTGMSGTDAEGNVVGTQMRINGDATVNVLSGQNNVINAVAVNLDEKATIDVSAGSTLQISTYNKDGLAWENPYDKGPAGKFIMDGGTITNNGNLNVRNDFIVNDGTVNVGQSGALEAHNLEINGGQFNIVGAEGSTGSDNGHGRTYPAFGAYNTFVMNGGEVALANGGRLWIGSASRSDLGSYHRMELKGGKITLNGNGWITGNKRLITEENSKGNYTGEAVLGFNTIGFDGVEVAVNGTGNTIDAVRTELTAGSLTINEGATLNIRATTSTNQPDNERDSALQAIEDASGFIVSGGSLDIAKSGSLTIENEIERFDIIGGTVTNNGLITAEKAQHEDGVERTDLTVTIGQGGQLNTSIFQDSFQVNNVEVKEGGVFNIAAYNSKTSSDQEENNRVLIGFDNHWTLNGGKLYLANEEFSGALKVGTSDKNLAHGDDSNPKGTGTLTVNSGAYTFTDLEIGKTGTVAVNGGSLTVNNLSYSQGGTGNTGSVTVGAQGSLTINEGLTIGAGDSSLTNEGTLKIGYSNFFTVEQGEDGKTIWTADEKSTGFVKGNGVIDLTGFTGDYSVDDLKTLQDSFTDAEADLQVTISGGTLVVGEDETLSADHVSGVIVADRDGVASAEGEFLVSDKTTVAGIDFASAAEAESLSIGTSDQADTTDKLTIEGGAKDIFKFAEGSEEKPVTAQNVQLGSSAASSGNINVETLNVVGTFDVVGSFTGQVIDLQQGAKATISGALDVDTLRGKDNAIATVSGVLKANVIGADTTVVEGGVLELGDRKEATEEVPPEGTGAEETLQLALLSARAGEEPTTPTKTEMVGQIQKLVHGDTGSVTTTSADGLSALAAAGFDSTNQAGLYIDATIGVEDTGFLIVGGSNNPAVDAGNAGTVTLASNTLAVINVDKLGGKAAFDATKLTSAATIVLDNITSVGELKLVEDEAATVSLEVEGLGEIKTASGLFMIEGSPTAETTLTIKYNDGFSSDNKLDSVLEDLVTNGTDAKNVDVLNAIANKNSGYVGTDGKLTSTGVQATKEYLATPVTAGTYNMAYDSAELISNALIQHNLNSKQGLGVWADVFYGSNETDTLYGNSGYSSDIYGGMIGVDYGFGEGARVGAALSIGSGDGDSEGSVSKYSTDSDFWGLSVYAGKDVGGLTFTADMSYLWLDNDISGSVAGASASESLDSTVFTLGARADWKAYEGDVMQVVPHVGVRWAQIDVDDYRGLSMDKMNVFEMPIGVTVKGNIATASGWTVTPAIDFTAAPQIGDTEVETIVGDVDVIDNVYNASIGVSAGNDAMRFGLSYKYGFGNDGRSNNTFNLKASYLF